MEGVSESGCRKRRLRLIIKEGIRSMKKKVGFGKLSGVILGFGIVGAILLFSVEGYTQPAAKASAEKSSVNPQKNVLIRLNSHGGTMTATASLSCQRFKQAVEAISHGRIKCEIYLAGQLGGSSVLPEMVRTGSIEMSVSAVDLFAGWIPWVNPLALPGLFPDLVSAWRAYDGWLGDQIGGGLDKVGIKSLGHVDCGFRGFMSRKVPITTPKDLVGMKVRSLGSPMWLGVWKAWGALPAALSWDELFSALQSGVVDGADSVQAAIFSSKLYEVIKYYSYPSGAYTAYWQIMNKKFFDGLSKEDQVLVIEAAKTARDFSHWMDIREATDSRTQIVKMGVKQIDLTPEQVDAFRKPLEKIYQEAGTKYGATEILNKIRGQ